MSPLGACIAGECQSQPVPGSVFCADHHAELMGKAAGVVEPEVEEMAKVAKSEDDLHPGMKKVYDQETGEAEWVPMEDFPMLDMGDIRHIPEVGQRPRQEWVDPREVNVSEVAKPDKAPDHMFFDECVWGLHGAIKESVAKAMLEASVTALRRL